MLGLNQIAPANFRSICAVVERIDFRKILFDFLLSFLLFAGSIHVNIYQLRRERGAVLLYATLGVLISTFAVGTGLFYLSSAMGIAIPYTYCLVFGALISPTDPIAVLSLLRQAGAPKDVEIKIIGESLFNDGVGIVVFLSLLSIATLGVEHVDPSHILEAFGKETLGGVVLGVALGFLGRYLFRLMYNAEIVTVHVSIALVMAGYFLANKIGVSGALAMVVLGLFMGDYLHERCDSPTVREHMNVFWKVLDDILNTLVFMLIGLELLVLDFEGRYLQLGGVAIGLVLLSRLISVWLLNFLLNKNHRSDVSGLSILTWAGLRGGISIALVLSLPESKWREMLIVTTYTVVVFSIIVQGLSIKGLAKKMLNAK